MKYIYHHLGLGDHIICNGLIRTIINNDENYKMFVKHHNKNSVEFMYKDLKNLSFIEVDNDYIVNNYLQMNNISESNIIRIGFNKLFELMPKYTFDEAFYVMMGVDFKLRFENFYIERDIQKEELVYNELNPNNEKYIFVHDDASKGYLIDKSRLPKNIKIIENDMRFKIFDFLKLIENAEEVHIMQSCFKELINSYIFKKPKFYSHNYVRNYPDELNSIGLNKVEILN
jgi:hypothetical protein